MKLLCKWNSIIILVILFNQFPILSQNDLSLHLLNRDFIYATKNIAWEFPKKWTLSLPEYNIYLKHNGGSLNAWSSKNNDHRIISLQQGWKNLLPNKSYSINGEQSIQGFFVGRKFNHWQIGLNQKFRSIGHFAYNRDLIGLMAYGNFGYLSAYETSKSKILSLKPQINVQSFHSIGLVSAYTGKKFAIGAGINYLSGIQEIHSDIKKFDIDIRDPFHLKSSEDWSIANTGFIDSLAFTSLKTHSLTKPYSSLFSQNPGLSFDLSMRLSIQNWVAGIEIRDLGNIHWKDGIKYSRAADIDYRGLQITNLLNIDKNIFNQIADTLKSLSKIISEKKAYHTSVPTKFKAEFQWLPKEKWTLGTAFYYIPNALSNKWAATIGGNYEFFPWWIAGASFNYSSDRFYSLGIHTGIKYSVFRFFISTENAPSLFLISRSKEFHGRIGMSIVW